MKKLIKTFTSMLLVGSVLATTGCSFISSLFPKEEPETYVVTFVQAGYGDITMEVVSGGSLSNNIPAPKDVVGYTVNWDKTDFSNITSNMTVTAVAVPNNYTITYQLLDGERNAIAGQASQTVTFDAAYELQTLEDYGYTFTGWLNGNSLVEQSGSAWKIASNVTLTPAWSNNYYTVSFIMPDGSVVAHRVECGDVLSAEQIPALPVIDGYDASWSVTDFSTVTGNTSVEVVKDAKSYTATYVLASDETLEGSLQETFFYNRDYSLKQPTREGYTFKYWKTEDGTAVAQSGVWKFLNNQVLTAEWTANNNEITFVHANGTTETREVLTGEALTDIPSPQAVAGYDVSWSVTDFSNVTSAMTVTAVLDPKTYTVTYSVEDATINGTTLPVVYNASYELAKPSKYGYTFVGWKTSDGTVIPTSDDAWQIASDVTLTAEWVENYYTVKFVHVDGTYNSYIVEKNDSFEDIPVCKQITGYTCSWPTGLDFSSVASDMIIGAVKIPNKYTVTYKLSTDESIDCETQFVIEYGATYSLATPTTTDEDLKFVCWKNVATGANMQQTGIWEITSDVTLKAVWKENEELWTGYF